MQDNQAERPEGRQAIWSVPGHLARWYGGIFVVQYFTFLGLTIWDEVVYRTGDNAVQTVLAVQRGMTANILNIVASTYAVLEVVMLASWLKERDQRKEREAVERAEAEAERAEAEAERAEAEAERAEAEAERAEAAERARQSESAQWLAWYQRMQAAQQEGRPFDEPPPVTPHNRNGNEQ